MNVLGLSLGLISVAHAFVKTQGSFVLEASYWPNHPSVCVGESTLNKTSTLMGLSFYNIGSQIMQDHHPRGCGNGVSGFGYGRCLGKKFIFRGTRGLVWVIFWKQKVIVWNHDLAQRHPHISFTDWWMPRNMLYKIQSWLSAVVYFHVLHILVPLVIMPVYRLVSCTGNHAWGFCLVCWSSCLRLLSRVLVIMPVHSYCKTFPAISTFRLTGAKWSQLKNRQWQNDQNMWSMEWPINSLCLVKKKLKRI